MSPYKIPYAGRRGRCAFKVVSHAPGEGETIHVPGQVTALWPAAQAFCGHGVPRVRHHSSAHRSFRWIVSCHSTGQGTHLGTEVPWWLRDSGESRYYTASLHGPRSSPGSQAGCRAVPQSHLHQVPGLHDHTLQAGGLASRHALSHCSGCWKSQVKVPEDAVPRERVPFWAFR